MPKNKLKRFAENATFPNLIQPKITFPPSDHPVKGNWNRDFFHNDHPVVLELGCGRGEYTINLSRLFPQKNFIGIDWKGARLWRGAKTGMEEQLANAGFLRIQIQNINTFFAKDEVDEIWITFPDPQPLKTGERKRLTSPRFLNYYRQLLKTNGTVHLKTDSRFLYDYTLQVIEDEKLELLQATGDVYHEPADDVLSIQTTYEKIWLRKGAKICYVKFKLTGRG